MAWRARKLRRYACQLAGEGSGDVAVGLPSLELHGRALQRVCVHGVPFIGVKSEYRLVTPQSVHVRIAGRGEGNASSATAPALC